MSRKSPRTQIKERIESVSGVGQVTIIGGRERQINVWLDPDKLRAYSVTPAEITTALRLQNIEFPSGRLDEGHDAKPASAHSEKSKKPEEFADVVVATRGTVIR
jgi:hydrophobic/amphiphilic exporter-1 (mainly G- bacteria), HAE1 family